MAWCSATKQAQKSRRLPYTCVEARRHFVALVRHSRRRTRRLRATNGTDSAEHFAGALVTNLCEPFSKLFGYRVSGLALVASRSRESGLAANAILSSLADRGTRCSLPIDVGSIALGVASHDWQEDLNGGSVGHCADVVAIADATLYYIDDLVQSLAASGVRPESRGAGDLVAAAVRAWGDDAPNHLEGDFAYVVLRQSSGEVLAARDPIGTRPLYFARYQGDLAIGSSPESLVRAGLARRDLNRQWLAELCAGLVVAGAETSYADVSSLRQGERLSWRPGTEPRIDRWFTAPAFTEDGTTRQTMDDAAGELRHLLTEAVRQRLDPRARSVVSLSGGRDSSAVYATARRLAGEQVRSVTLSYPPGDRGREDETVLEILSRCGGSPEWIETMSIGFLDGVQAGSTRPDAFAHPYESQSHAVASRAASLGSHVILNGLGGDTLFHAEASFLADLALGGRLREFAREWRRQQAPWRPDLLFRWGVLPRFGPGARSFLAALRGGRPITDMMERPVPPWAFGPSADAALARARFWSDPLTGVGRHGVADRERRMMILGAFAGRIVPEYCRLSLTHGIEQRSPLYDLRVMRFAATRPRRERQVGGDYKLLLRKAMEGWLPESVTGPRPRPTGFAGGYLERAFSAAIPQITRGHELASRADQFGLILAHQYRVAVRELQRESSHPHLSALILTSLVDRWLIRNEALSGNRE